MNFVKRTLSDFEFLFTVKIQNEKASGWKLSWFHYFNVLFLFVWQTKTVLKFIYWLSFEDSVPKKQNVVPKNYICVVWKKQYHELKNKSVLIMTRSQRGIGLLFYFFGSSK